MGTAQRRSIAEALVGAGWSASTPAAIIWNASHRETSVWSGPLDALADAPTEGEAPGTIVIGDVVAIREPLIARNAPASEVRHA
jgi:siroheme synthase